LRLPLLLGCIFLVSLGSLGFAVITATFGGCGVAVFYVGPFATYLCSVLDQRNPNHVALILFVLA
jgi:hypothetical protein